MFIISNNTRLHVRSLSINLTIQLLLISKDLFLSFSTQKIKTLKQALASPQLNQNQKLLNIQQKYNDSKQTIQDVMKNKISNLNWSKVTILKNKFESNQLYYYLTQPSIIQIIGPKGGGKTVTILYLSKLFLNYNQDKYLYILNCTSGITFSRLKMLDKNKYQYIDIFQIQNLMRIIDILLEMNRVGMIVLEGVINLFLGMEKQKTSLGQNLIKLRQKGWIILYSNYINTKLQLGEQQVLNPTGYGSRVFSGLPDFKLLVQIQDDKQKDIIIARTLKNLDNSYQCYRGTINEKGLDFLQMISL